MSYGDHIYVRRPLGYTHHGIDCGDGTVIHFSGEPGSSKVHASICRTDLDSFLDGGRLQIRRYGRRLDPSETVQRAESRLGEPRYHVLASNCEHFAEWCCSNQTRSDQVKNAVSTVAQVGLVGATVVGAGAVVATAGAVSGVSAAGIMSGLATAGAVAGGGAAMGPGVISALPATAAVALTHYVFGDDGTKPNEERSARRDARVAGVCGAAAGALGGVGVLGAVGAPGLGAVGISTGLAAIGGASGGAGAGMLAGAAILAVAPAALTCGAAVGVYLTSRFVRALLADDPVPHAA